MFSSWYDVLSTTLSSPLLLFVHPPGAETADTLPDRSLDDCIARRSTGQSWHRSFGFNNLWPFCRSFDYSGYVRWAIYVHGYVGGNVSDISFFSTLSLCKSCRCARSIRINAWIQFFFFFFLKLRVSIVRCKNCVWCVNFSYYSIWRVILQWFV